MELNSNYMATTLWASVHCSKLKNNSLANTFFMLLTRTTIVFWMRSCFF